MRADSGFWHSWRMVSVCRKTTDLCLAADGPSAMRVETAVGPHRVVPWPRAMPGPAPPSPVLKVERRRRAVLARDRLHSLRKQARRRASAAHRPAAGDSPAGRVPTGPLRALLQLSRLHHRRSRDGGVPGSGEWPPGPAASGRGIENAINSRPEVRRGAEPSPQRAASPPTPAWMAVL